MPTYDELNPVTQSGSLKMVRMGDWKLVFDMMGNGELYNVARDPYELNNLWNAGEGEQIQAAAAGGTAPMDNSNSGRPAARCLHAEAGAAWMVRQLNGGGNSLPLLG